MIAVEQRNKIIKTLNGRIKEFTCPMCKEKQFAMQSAYLLNTLHEDLDNISFLQGRGIPTIPIICGNCGFISQHALYPLGLLTEEGDLK